MTYDLTIAHHSGEFYLVLKRFTDRFLSEVSSQHYQITDDFVQYLNYKGEEVADSPDELIIQMLMIPVFSNYYSHHAEALSNSRYRILKYLYLLRQRKTGLKPYLDPLRGRLAARWLNAKLRNRSRDNDASGFSPRLLNWMEASGEFREEVIRLRKWECFLEAQSFEYRNRFQVLTNTLRADFISLSRSHLAPFLPNVESFVKDSRKDYRGREDFFFTGRNTEEYYLNMLGAEIMNRALRPSFEATTKKIVLLPTCMRNLPDNCKAELSGKEMKCRGCNKNCNAGKIYHKFRETADEVVLIPHSSDFTRWLKKWEGQKDTGLIGVACILNLMLGGFEMKNLNIPSQCVFLDYPGCRNHWDIFGSGIPTNLNHEKLGEILRSREELKPETG